jgi:hypothetical protein
MHRGIIVALSDMHCGNKYGLMCPTTTIRSVNGEKEDVGSLVGYTEWNRYLWDDVYVDAIRNVEELADGDDIYVIHNGDLVQGDKHGDDLSSTRMSDQIVVAADCIRQWCEIDNVVGVRLTTGTGAHTFGEGSATEMVSELLSREYKSKDVESIDHGLLDVFGVSVDYAHHGPSPGTKEWVTGNAARSYARDLMMQEVFHGEIPPSLVIRSHFHKYVREVVTMIVGDIEFETTIVVTPSLCLLGSYGRQAMRSISRVKNGVVAFEVIDGRLHNTHRFIKTIDLRKREVFDG